LEWLTGYCPVVRHAYAVVKPGQKPALVVPTAADAWYARRWTTLDEVVVAGEGDIIDRKDLPSGVGALLGDVRGRVGVVGLGHIVPAGEAPLLEQAIGGPLEDATPVVAELKAVKDEEDVQHLERTAATADAAVAELLTEVRAGMTGWEASASL